MFPQKFSSPKYNERKLNLICSAISSKNVIRFYYEDEIRECHPHLIAFNAEGTPFLSAWFVSGYSSSGIPPEWRSYKTAQIDGIEILEDSFFEIHKDFNLSKYESDRIYCVVD